MGCNGSPAFFASDVWPNYLARWKCGQSGCHDAQSGHGYFRLTDPTCPVPVPGGEVCPPLPTTPLTQWTDNWRTNYQNSARFLNCGDPTASPLLIIPEGKGQPHPGGVIFAGQDATDAETLFTQWASMP